MAALTSAQIRAAGLTDWRHSVRGLQARYATGSFATGLAFTNAVGAAAEAANHHPDITLTYPLVDIMLISHDLGAITERDVNLARQISEIARLQGLAAAPPEATAPGEPDSQI